MLSEAALPAVLQVVSRVGGFPAEAPAPEPDDDLYGLGLDSMQLLAVWSAVEQRFCLERGSLGATHAVTPRAIAATLARILQQRPPAADARPPLDRGWIETRIPHRPPALLLDRVTALEPGVRGAAEVELSAALPWFGGHFPARPVLPGVAVVEACTQLVAVVCAPPPWDAVAAPEYLAAIERFKFTTPAVPGETLTLEVWLGRRSGGLLQVRARARVERRPVAEGLLSVTLRDENRSA